MALELFDIVILMMIFILLYSVVFFLMLYRGRNKIEPEINTDYSITFLVPVYNGESTIRETLKSLKDLDYPKEKIEIIVMNDQSTDKSKEIAESEGVKVVDIKKGGKGKAINAGIEIAKNELIGIVDDDSVLDSKALKKSLGHFKDPKVASVTGVIFPKEQKGILADIQKLEYLFIAWQRKNFEYIESIYVTPGPMSIYRKKILTEIGGFDENILTEDIEIGVRILDNGYKIRMSTESRCYTEVPTKIREWIKQRTRWYIGGIQTVVKYKHRLFKNMNIVSTFVIPFVIFIFLVITINFFIIFFIFLNTIYEISLKIFYSFLVNGNVFSSLEVLDFRGLIGYMSIMVTIISIFYLVKNFNFFRKKIGFNEIKAFILTLLFYTPLLMILFIYSVIKYMRGKKEW